jgi:dTDP-4-amino-4,6-dideoxygalactose transaminase
VYSIPLSHTPLDSVALAKVLRKYESEPVMKLVHDFESVLRQFTASRNVLALNSGTSAIHLALRAAGVGPGDDVLVSTFTYVASVNPIIYIGANPVFIDSERDTWNMDPALLAQAIERQPGKLPKAILVVHAYGMPANMGAILKLANRYAIPVIEDAAEAIGSKWEGKMLGTMGRCGILSFNNNKLITTYGGGALMTDDDELYRKALLLASQAREDKPHYEHREIGYNYRMNPLAAAQGLLAMESAEDKVTKRRAIFDYYLASILKYRKIRVHKEQGGCFSNRWLTAIELPGKDVGRAQETFRESGIEVRPLWKPMHEQPVFQRFKSFNSGISSSLFDRGITLPSSDSLSENDREKVVSIFKKLGYSME